MVKSEAVIANVMAGGLIATINITVAISVAALMFAGTNPAYFATGVSALLVGTLILGLGGSLGSGFPGIIVAPRSGLAPVFVTLVASIITMMNNEGNSAGIMPTVIMMIMITTAGAGVVLMILGTLKLGRLVRYIPYPVMGGFFAGIGFLFVKGGIGVASTVSVSIDNLDQLFSTSVLLLVFPALMFAVALYWAQRRINHWAVFPVLLLASFVIFYTIFMVNGYSFENAVSKGWLPEVANTSTRIPLFNFADFAHIDWTIISAQSSSIIVVSILCAIILLLDVSGVEIITSRDLNPNRELKVAGFTNVVNGFLGGYPGVHVASDTAFTYKLGGTGRLMGFTYAAAVGIAIVAGTGFIGVIPTFILGGLLIYVGIDFLMDWAWQSRKDLPLSDYLVVLSILAAIAAAGILEGVAFGIAVATILFVISYSRVSIVRSVFSGADHASYVDRDLKTRAVLNSEAEQILIIKLQGFIFFGTADGLIATLKHHLSRNEDEQGIRYLVLDFQHVSQLDTSAVQAFSKLAQLADKEHIHIAITGIDGSIRQRLNGISFFNNESATVRRVEARHIDDGVAWCEEQILADIDNEAEDSHVEIENLLVQVVGDEQNARLAAPFFKSVKAKKGEYLFRQGDEGDCLYLLHSGAAAVVLPAEDGQGRVVRVYRAGAVVGEMALYTGAPRSADVRIEESGLLFRLDIAAMRDMQEQHPSAAGQFHAFIVRVLAERLDRANKEKLRSM